VEKAAARAEIKRRLGRLTPRDRTEKSARALNLLVGVQEYRAAHCVLLFASLPDEIDTLPIIRRALSDGKRVILPRCVMRTRQLVLCPISDVDRDLAIGTLGIREPIGDGTVATAEIDFAVIPARAYDEEGNRLGRGAGFYDRLLGDPSFRAIRCGLAYEEQVLVGLPCEAHDRPVEIIVTDRKVRRIRQAC